MGKQGESRKNIEKHEKTGRIKEKHRKTRGNRGNQGKTEKHGKIRENTEKHGKTGRIKEKHRHFMVLASLKSYRKIPKIGPGAYIFQKALFRGLIFGGAYIRRGFCTEGNLRFKIDWASL